jgi:tripeptidyl-peptidase-2
MLIFDGEKKYLGMSDAHPSTIQASKGTVVIRLQIRHDDPTKLEKLQDLVIWIERSLSKDIVLTAYGRRDEMMLGKNPLKKRTLRKGTSASVFFAEPVHSKLPTGCGVGHRLIGVATLGSGDANLPGDNKRPGGFPVYYYVGPKPNKESSLEADPPQSTVKPTAEQKMNDAVRDLKVDYLGKLTKEEKLDGTFEKLYENLVKEYPDHLPLLMVRLRHLATTQPTTTERLPEIAQAAEAVISHISEDELALNLGRKLDDTDANAVKVRDEVKEKKTFLVEALFRLALVYAEVDTHSSSSSAGKFDEIVKRIKSWVDMDKTKYAAVSIARERRAGNYGLAIKIINKLLSKEIKDKDLIKSFTKAELIEMRIDLLEKLGYSRLVEFERKNRVIACPKFYSSF